jgi:glutathione S-transferase
MMILRSLPASPFGRKIRIAFALLGFEDELQLQAANTNDPADTVRLQNPLGKIPVLIDEKGEAYYDSRVILEYLDNRAGGGVILPHDSKSRVSALRLQALGDGICDASLLQVYEARFRPVEKHEPKWLDHQAGKVSRALQHLEDSPPAISDLPHVGQISVACALGYRDLRFGGTWREEYPNLVVWLNKFAAAVPSFTATAA